MAKKFEDKVWLAQPIAGGQKVKCDCGCDVIESDAIPTRVFKNTWMVFNGKLTRFAGNCEIIVCRDCLVANKYVDIERSHALPPRDPNAEIKADEYLSKALEGKRVKNKDGSYGGTITASEYRERKAKERAHAKKLANLKGGRVFKKGIKPPAHPTNCNRVITVSDRGKVTIKRKG